MTRSFGGMFGRSMFTPILEHMIKALDCMEALRELIGRFVEKDYDALKNLSQRIAKLEHDADIIKEEFRDGFSKSLLMAVNRSDMLTLIKAQDGISDECEDIAKLASIRETAFTEELKAIFVELTSKVYESVKSLKDLEEFIETSSGGDPEKIEEMIKIVQVKEWESDQLQLKFMKTLFSQEKQIDTVSLFILRDLCNMVGKIANHAENVGDCLRRIVAR
ncbi:MAG: TIGR00153 family protein [Elusimicrobia bacterium]|nr:TIGR00153 family protein [Elusimicrobiota bacterium]